MMLVFFDQVREYQYVVQIHHNRFVKARGKDLVY